VNDQAQFASNLAKGFAKIASLFANIFAKLRDNFA